MNEIRHKFRLPPTIRRQSDFRRITRSGVKFRNSFLQLTVSRKKNLGAVGYTIPEKAIKNSVDRNRVRRMLKEAVRLWWNEIEPGNEIILSVRQFPEINHAWYVELIFLKLIKESRIMIKSSAEEIDRRILEIDSFLRERGIEICGE